MSENLLNADDIKFYANQLTSTVNPFRPMVDQISRSFAETGEVVRSLIIRPYPVVAGTIEVDYDGTCNRIVAVGENEDTIAVVTQPKPPVIIPPKRKRSLFASSWRKSKSVAPATAY